jgi:hypothetical protein
MKGLYHGSQSLFLPGCVDRTCGAVPQALLAVAIGTHCQSSVPSAAGDPTTQALQRTEALERSHLQASLRGLGAGGILHFLGAHVKLQCNFNSSSK